MALGLSPRGAEVSLKRPMKIIIANTDRRISQRCAESLVQSGAAAWLECGRLKMTSRPGEEGQIFRWGSFSHFELPGELRSFRHLGNVRMNGCLINQAASGDLR